MNRLVKMFSQFWDDNIRSATISTSGTSGIASQELGQGEDWKQQFTCADRTEKRGMARRGAPEAVRGWAWAHLLHLTVPAEQGITVQLYEKALKDIFGPGLTYSTIQLASEPFLYGVMHDLEPPVEVFAWRRVMTVLAHRHPHVSFCPLLPQLLHIMSWYFGCGGDCAEEALLWAAGEELLQNAVMQKSKHLRNWFIPGVCRKEHLVFERILRELVKREAPLLTMHFERIGYQAPWLALLSDLVGLYDEWVLVRIIDCFLAEGFKVVVRMAVGNLLIKQSQLLSIQDHEELNHVILAQKPAGKDLFKAAFNIHFSRQIFDTFKMKFAKKYIEDFDLHDALVLHKMMPRLAAKSTIVEFRGWEYFWQWLPSRHQQKQAELVYYSNDHGHSLQTMYLKCSLHEPLLLFVECFGDEGNVTKIIGAFLSRALVCRLQKGEFGSGETFLFSLTPWPPLHYPWVPGNPSLFITCNDSEMTVGIGGLVMNRDLSLVSSYASAVFGSPALLPKSSTIKSVQVWSLK